VLGRTLSGCETKWSSVSKGAVMALARELYVRGHPRKDLAGLFGVGSLHLLDHLSPDLPA